MSVVAYKHLKKKTVVIFIHLNVLDEHKTMKTDFVIAIESVKLKTNNKKKTLQITIQIITFIKMYT